jgi:hypothetical protein
LTTDGNQALIVELPDGATIKLASQLRHEDNGVEEI